MEQRNNKWTGIIIALVIGLAVGYFACHSMGKVNVADQTGAATTSPVASQTNSGEMPFYVAIDPNILKQLDAYMYAGNIKEGNEFLRTSFSQMVNNSGNPTNLFWYKCYRGPGGIQGYTTWKGYISDSDCVYLGQWD